MGVRNKDILAAIKSVMEYTANFDFESFRSEPKTIDADIRNFEVIDEAAASYARRNCRGSFTNPMAKYVLYEKRAAA